MTDAQIKAARLKHEQFIKAQLHNKKTVATFVDFLNGGNK